MGLFGEITSRAVSSGTTNPFNRTLDSARAEKRLEAKNKALINFAKVSKGEDANKKFLPKDATREFTFGLDD